MHFAHSTEGRTVKPSILKATRIDGKWWHCRLALILLRLSNSCSWRPVHCFHTTLGSLALTSVELWFDLNHPVEAWASLEVWWGTVLLTHSHGVEEQLLCNCISVCFDLFKSSGVEMVKVVAAGTSHWTTAPPGKMVQRCVHLQWVAWATTMSSSG